MIPTSTTTAPSCTMLALIAPGVPMAATNMSALQVRAGWGYFDPGAAAGGKLFYGDYINGYQNPPINWAINTSRKRAFFEMLARVTGFEGFPN